MKRNLKRTPGRVLTHDVDTLLHQTFIANNRTLRG
jgi:hypothetical protein